LHDSPLEHGRHGEPPLHCTPINDRCYSNAELAGARRKTDRVVCSMPLGTPLVEALEQPGPVREGGNAGVPRRKGRGSGRIRYIRSFAKAGIEAGSGVEAADLLQTEVGGEAVAVGGAVERAVMKYAPWLR